MSGEIEIMQTDGVPANAKKYQVEMVSFDPDDHQQVNVSHSTELIPDEYEHNDNKLGLVIIFYSKWDIRNANLIQKALVDQNYDVPEENLINLSTNEAVLNHVNQVANGNHDDKSCLILIMMGNAVREGQFLPEDETERNKTIPIKDVWSAFTGNRCITFRNKPKIFIFQSSRSISSVQVDSRVFTAEPPKQAYQVPTEADILLIYKRIEDTDERHSFIEDLCNNVDEFGAKDDIIGLVTETNINDEKRPLIISTLTKKFYVASSEHRGYNYEFWNSQNKTLDILHKLSYKIQKLEANQTSQRSSTLLAVNKWKQVTKNNPNESSKIDVLDSTVESNQITMAASASSYDARPPKKIPIDKRRPWR